MSMRITGLATGLDIDQLIKETMRPQRIKIQQVQQNKEIAEIRQTLYREIIKESREFYNKYLDIAKSDSILLSKNWSSVKYTSTDEGAVTVKALSGAKADNYTVDVQSVAKSATAILTTKDIERGNKISITLEGVDDPIEVNVSGKTNAQIVSDLNAALSAAGSDITATSSDFAKGIVLQTKSMGSSASITYALKDSNGNDILAQDNAGNTIEDDEGNPKTISGVAEGSNADITIINSSGIRYEHTGTTNSITLDGVQFAFNEVPLDGNPIRVVGRVDATDIKDKLVSFINDYNTLLEKLNTLTMENRNRNFMPLTDDQKKEMSETEINLWNDKVKKGQLKRDSDLIRISNKMKEATKSLFNGQISYLEKVGIRPISEYSSTKNGTLTIDESKLTEALENNLDDVMKLFTATRPTDTTMSDAEKYTGTGIAQRLRSALNDETMVSSARLLQKAGIEGSSTVANNELSKSIEKFERRMSDMETIFSRREQQLYTKYSKLETMMNKLNSQQSYLLSQLGMG